LGLRNIENKGNFNKLHQSPRKETTSRKRQEVKTALFFPVLFLVPCGLATAGEQNEKLVLDLWDVAYLSGGRAGYIHTEVREVKKDEQSSFVTTASLNLKIKRNNTPIELRMDTGTQESADGAVLGVFMRQYLGQNKKLTIVGRVKGKQLELTLDENKPLQPAPWNDKVVGLYRQQMLFKDRNVKPGDEFSYLSFEPSINLVVNTHVKIKDWESVELFGGQIQKKLLRVEVTPEKIENVQLPTLVSWLDERFEAIRSEVDIPGLGVMTLYRSTKAGALAPGNLASVTDIGIGQLVRLTKPIANPYAAKKAAYLIRIKGDAEPETAFVTGERQTVKNVQKDTFELHVDAKAAGKPVGKKEADEFLQSSYFINSNDALVKNLAARAVGNEKDPWKKVLRIENWVHDNMRGRNHEAMATADHVARTLEGDCSEYAMLMAAMCRAAGIPSRTAVGLIYANVNGQGPCFSFHMWTEVLVDDTWHGVDATLGQGYVGATHLKITDHSWNETRSLTPLLPVIRVLGKISVEVLEVE
jgi:hypothetical protein